MTALHSPTVKLDTAALPTAAMEGLYVHIPFCFHKCHYCDFYSITRQTPQRMERFVDLILREADQWAGIRKREELKPRTVFFGGGTPTLLPLEQMRRLITGLRSRFDLESCAEWTCEANPATVSPEYCRMMFEAGVDRMSFGAQSFDPVELTALERHHDPDDVPRSLKMARAAGFERLNVDLIYAIPSQTLEAWMRSLQRAIDLGMEHLSCYGLTYESNTPMGVRRRLGQIRGTEPELEIEMMRATRRSLAGAGLAAYEISNYAKPGQECRHNLMYWRGGNYLGLGPSAASHVEGWRWRNQPHLGEWESAVEGDELPAIEVETLTPAHRAGELAMLLLRLSAGLNYAEFAARSGYDAKSLFAEVIERLGRPGLLEVGETSIRLSESGLPVADAVAAEFLAAARQ